MNLPKKILISFLGGTAVLIILLTIVFSAQISSNTEQTIVRSMNELMTYCASAVKQSLYTGGFSFDESGFAAAAENTSEEINSMLNCGFAFYSTDGRQLFSTYADDGLSEKERRDLRYAMNGKSAYTVLTDNGECTAYLSFGLYYGGQSMGIIRLKSDYSEIYRSNSRTLRTILISTVVILSLTASAAALILSKMLKPVKMISEELKRTGLNPERAETIPVTRSDELGTLISQYNKMATTIRSQLATIRMESERLAKTLEYRKAFYDNLTHELKTPLTIILGYSEMMEQTDFEDMDFVRKGTREIITESKRLRDMVTGLLESSRGISAAFKFEKTDMMELIGSVCSSMNIKAERYGSRISASLCEAYVFGSQEQLRQLFVNLLDNAVKYGEPGKEISAVMHSSGDTLTVTVSNVPEQGRHLENSDRIFIPFYRSRDITRREQGSVGLGLSICKNIADEHSGSISAVDKDDLVTFTVSLPLYKSEEEDK